MSKQDHAEFLGFPLPNPDELLARQSLLSITSARRSEAGDTQLGGPYRKAIGRLQLNESTLQGFMLGWDNCTQVRASSSLYRSEQSLAAAYTPRDLQVLTGSGQSFPSCHYS